MSANPMHVCCGAHCRTTGLPCKNRPMLGKARCRMHGGTAGRPTTTGCYTQSARLATHERGALARLIVQVRQASEP